MGWINFHLESVFGTLLNARGDQTILRVQNLKTQVVKMQKEDVLYDSHSRATSSAAKFSKY